MGITLNGYVRVKLTEAGRERLRETRDAIVDEYPRLENTLRDPLIEEDADGWSEWQLWWLMQTFGPVCGAGSMMPFSDFEIVER